MLAIYERDRGLPPGVIRSDLHLRTAIENNRIRALDTVAELGYPGVSFEQAVAILMDDIERTKKLPGWKKHRQDAKGVNFGYAYGMRESKFVVYARTSYGVEFTMEEAHAAREAYMAAYTRIPLWHDEVLRSVAQAPFTVTMFGRYRTYEEEDRLSAINNLVQSAASDITLLGMIQTERGLRAEGLDARIIGTIHDSIMIDVSEKDAERAKEIGLYNFENIDTSAFGFTIPVPIKAEAKLGRTW